MNRAEAAAVAEMAVTIAELRAAMAEAVAEAAAFKAVVDGLGEFAGVMVAVADQAYAMGRAAVDDRQAEANARKARAKFRLVCDNAPKAATTAAPKSRARRKPGGAA